MSGAGPWTPRPLQRGAAQGGGTPPVFGQSLARALRLFAAGAVGGTLSVVSLGVFVLPATVQCRGATRALRVDRELQQRCLELGITPAELEALEAAEAPGSGLMMPGPSPERRP